MIAVMLGGCATNVESNNIVASTAVASANKEIVSLVSFKAVEHNIPVKLAHAIIHVESRHHPHVRHAGHYGLGQINCGTAKGIGFKGDCKALLNPDINLTYSFKYLRMALDIANNNECHAATLYQGGLGVRPRPSRYCRKVLDSKKFF